jgi:cytochrome-b5 reductase
MVFSPSEFRPFTLEKIMRINHNVSLFRFKLPTSTDVAGLPVASCVLFRSHITKDGKTEEIVRPYTPTSVEAAEGHVDFVIKDYPQGNMSRHVHSLKVGDTIDIKGPFEKYKWENKPVAYVGMVAGNYYIHLMIE